MKKILLVGGTGALCAYLVPDMLEMGWQVDVVSLDNRVSYRGDLHYYCFDAKDIPKMEALLKNEYDAVIDFMIYRDAEGYRPYAKMYLENTSHYIFLSTYRIYAGNHPIMEDSPRLLEASKDFAFLASGDYAIYKAWEENILRTSGKTNWTILRPAITYSKRRFQLITLEADVLVYRMMNGKTVLLPEPAMDVQATMSWSGDFSKMVSRLVLNPQAYTEAFTISTSEHHTWREIAEFYRDIAGLRYELVDTDTFLDLWSPGSIQARSQLVYDRYFDRIVDNSKILRVTGLQQKDFMPLKTGLAKELADVKPDTFRDGNPANERMDAYITRTHM